MNDKCCEKLMVVSTPPWGTLMGFFHPKLYSKCENCGKEYLYIWNSGGWLTDNPGYNRREVTEKDRNRL